MKKSPNSHPPAVVAKQLELRCCTILNKLFMNRQDACSTRKFTLCGTGILPVLEKGARGELELTNLKPGGRASRNEFPGRTWKKPTKKHLQKGALMNMNFPCPTKLLRVMPGSARAGRCSYHRSH